MASHGTTGGDFEEEGQMSIEREDLMRSLRKVWLSEAWLSDDEEARKPAVIEAEKIQAELDRLDAARMGPAVRHRLDIEASVKEDRERDNLENG